ncbi:unnamed protein product [Tuber melanosporum]|uniref:(Perigord truffle) hypothetical protein n=1 Tax=Tuber melanosporum (strain Mel28) TaxID=656061 RepID=D5GNY3_TUBMM|nr:uncharacterized protein GSTUM_00011583001 [Tuber melanosporum]CAZ86226.1 unnamed protein product [Tuber melanosporum]
MSSDIITIHTRVSSDLHTPRPTEPIRPLFEDNESESELEEPPQSIVEKLHLPNRIALHVTTDGRDDCKVDFECNDLKWGIEISSSSTYPTLHDDVLSFRYYVNEDNQEEYALFKVWVMLFWYFQLPAPSADLIPNKQGSPRGSWQVHFNNTGPFFKLANLQAVEAAGLVSFPDSGAASGEWIGAYATRVGFWQLPPEPFLNPVCTSKKPLHMPKPVEYTFTDRVRHPVRPRPQPNGDMYTRWIPSFGQFLTFRLTDLDEDTEVVHRWMNDPRVSMFWGEEAEDPEKTRSFLKKGLGSKHFFPIIGCWDDEPFGYFEVYWVKEDALGRYASDVDMWDRGVHCLVGEQKFRGPHRVGVWISGLVHFMFLDDPRTQTVMLEPRVDNTKFIKYLVDAGFYKEKEFAFPHKQAALMKLKREAWEGPLC